MTTPPEPPPPAPDGQPGVPQPWGQDDAPLPPWPAGASGATAPKESSRPIWGGALIVLGICLLGLFGLVAPSGPWRTVASALGGLATIFPVVAIVLLFPETTRRWALGMLLGYGLALVIAFVGCIGLIVAYSRSSST